jgi:two-component system, sensor histidine kinase and response regulator
LQTEKALNGKEALELVTKRKSEDLKSPYNCSRNRNNYKLIFMNCRMPVMDGFQATQEIRKDFEPSQIHIAAFTAYASESFKKRFYEAGMDSFLTKTVSDDKILPILESLYIKPRHL